MTWHRFTPDSWARIEDVARRRDVLSREATNTRAWNPRYNLLGAAGEAIYSAHTGSPWNQTIAIRDGGTDFPGIDVKATPHWRSPRLLRLATDPLKAPVYVLVALDLDEQRGRVVGYATRQMLADAPLREYGYGPTRTLLEAELLSVDELLGSLIGVAA